MFEVLNSRYVRKLIGKTWWLYSQAVQTLTIFITVKGKISEQHEQRWRAADTEVWIHDHARLFRIFFFRLSFFCFARLNISPKLRKIWLISCMRAGSGEAIIFCVFNRILIIHRLTEDEQNVSKVKRKPCLWKKKQTRPSLNTNWNAIMFPLLIRKRAGYVALLRGMG